MKENMLKDFLEEECNETTTNEILALISSKNGEDYRHEFNFNRHNLYFDFDSAMAKIEDALEWYEEQVITLPIAQLASILRSGSKELLFSVEKVRIY